MNELRIETNCLGFELHCGERLVALFRANEEISRDESPKPCFAPIYTPSGKLITGYRPKDHLWHTGLYFGWVHVNEIHNLWGGPWYSPEAGKYEYFPGTHGVQEHVAFDKLESDGAQVVAEESLIWRGGSDELLANEKRVYTFAQFEDRPGTIWRIETQIAPAIDKLTISPSKAARYSGLMLRMGPPFSDAKHRDSEGRIGHEATMGASARWCAAEGACGGAVALFDHPANVNHPTKWFTRPRLLGSAAAMDKDIEIEKGKPLTLKYAFLVLDENPSDKWLNEQYEAFSSS